MRDLVEYILKQLVTKPEEVAVEESRSQEGVNITATVSPEDMGLVIGRAGQTIKAIRRLLTVRAIVENVRVNLSLNEPEGGRKVEENAPEEAETEEEPNNTPEETDESAKEG